MRKSAVEEPKYFHGTPPKRNANTLWDRSSANDPAQLFDRRWALTVLDETLRRLETEHVATSKERVFRQLQGLLMGDGESQSYTDAASELAITEAAVKMAVMRLRARCRELLRDEIARTVANPLEIE